LSYWPARLGIDSWAPLKVYKYGLRLHMLPELIPWNRFLGSLKVKNFGLRTPEMNNLADSGADRKLNLDEKPE
jgi:hypothetical protein